MNTKVNFTKLNKIYIKDTSNMFSKRTLPLTRLHDWWMVRTSFWSESWPNHIGLNPISYLDITTRKILL